GTNFNTLNHVEVNLGPEMLHAHLLADVFELFGQEGIGTAAGSDEPHHARGAAHHVPRLVRHLHLDEDVAGTNLLRHNALLAVLDLDVLFHGHDDVEDLVFHAHGDHPLLQVGLHFVFVAGISVDDIPRSGRAGAVFSRLLRLVGGFLLACAGAVDILVGFVGHRRRSPALLDFALPMGGRHHVRPLLTWT